MNAPIMPGVTIGDNRIIGAGAIVAHDIPSGSIAIGIPAHAIETVEECMEKNKKDIVRTKYLSWEEKRLWVEEYGV